MKRWHLNVKCCRRPHVLHSVSLLHARINMYKSLSKHVCSVLENDPITNRTKKGTRKCANEGAKHGTKKGRQRARQKVFKKNQIQSAKTGFLRGAKDACRRPRIPDVTHAMERPVWSRPGEHFWRRFGKYVWAHFWAHFSAHLWAQFSANCSACLWAHESQRSANSQQATNHTLLNRTSTQQSFRTDCS